jgi:drug efflux transport system permease protein
MFGKIYSLIIKEFITILQDTKTRIVLISPPLVQLFIFAFAATLDVENVTIGVYNQDYGKQSTELVKRFVESKTFTNIKFFNNYNQIKTSLDNQEVIMVIHIDTTFSKKILAKEIAKVQLLLDGRKSNSSQIVLGYANKIIDQYSNELSKQFNLISPDTILIPRNWYNPNLLYKWFTVPGLVGILTMLISLVITSLSIAREREIGTFEQLLVSPMRPLDILIGKTIPAIILGMVEGSIILCAAIFIFKIPFTGSLLALYFSMFLFVLSIVGIGLFLSSLCKTQQQALLSVFVFMSPAVILSGFATPIENMPIFLQKITLINPLRFFIVIVRGIFLKNLPFAEVLKNIYPIALIALFNLLFATWFFRKRIE